MNVELPTCPTCGASGFDGCRTRSGRALFTWHAKRSAELERRKVKAEADERAAVLERRLPDVYLLRDYQGAIVGTFRARPGRQLYARPRCPGRARGRRR